MRAIPLQTLTQEDLGAWGRLADRAVEPNPFFEPAFATLAAASLGADDVRLLVAENDGEWSGCLPVQMRHLLGIPLLAADWKHPYSFLGTPLIAAARTEEFAAALADTLLAREHGRFLMLRRTSTGPVLAAIREAAERSGKLAPLFERSFERGAYEGRPVDQELAWMKSRRRSELKRQRRKLGEELGEEVVVRDRSDADAAIDAFLRLEASGWKGRGGTAMDSSEDSAELFRGLQEKLSGRLQIRALEAGGRTLAMTCDIAAGEILFGFKSAYDEELRRFSPGVQLQADNFGFFDREREERLFDSCGEPGNEAINALWPDRRSLTTVLLGRRGASGKILSRLLDRAYEARAGRLAAGTETSAKR